VDLLVAVVVVVYLRLLQQQLADQAAVVQEDQAQVRVTHHLSLEQQTLAAVVVAVV
jgi:hypothetical protein